MRFESHAALVDFYRANLTTPGCEDLTILPVGDVIHVASAQRGYGVMPLAAFKRMIEELPTKAHRLGCVTVLICSDSRESRGLDLVRWLDGKCQEQGFNLMAIRGSRLRSTAEALRDMRAAFNVTHN
jgi:hypothetical protein